MEVRIQFKDTTSGIFRDVGRNELVLRIQPSEAVYLKLNTKEPGLRMRAIPTEMDLTYKRRFTDPKIPEAYEALILDALNGDHSNFVRADELDYAWQVSVPLRPSQGKKKFLGKERLRSYDDQLICFVVFLDLHAHLALDRREGRSGPQASAVPLWFTRSEEYRRVRSQVRLHTICRGIVSFSQFSPLAFLNPPPPLYTHAARGQSQTQPTCDVTVDIGQDPSGKQKRRS